MLFLSLEMPIIKNTDTALKVLVVQVIDAATHGGTVKDPVLDKMLKNVNIILKNNRYEYHMAAENLPIDKVYDELCSCSADAEMRWGRVVAIFTLLYVYAEQNRDFQSKLRDIKEIFTKFLLKEVAPWIRCQGGMSIYVNPCKHYPLYVMAVFGVAMIYVVCHRYHLI